VLYISHATVMTELHEPQQRISALAPIDAVLGHISRLAKPVKPREVWVSTAINRVLANDVAVAEPLPPMAVSLRDGWAVRSELISDASPYAPAALAAIPEWAELGRPVPRGADAIIAPDAVLLAGGMAEVVSTARPGEGLLAAGADATPGQPLRHAGEPIREIDAAVLRAVGIPRVQVRDAQIGIVCANELIDEIDDTVAPLIARAIDAEGCTARIRRANFGTRKAFERALEDETADALITIGGTGAGRHDKAVTTLAGVGRIDVHGMGLVPGDTAAIGSIGARPVLLLPGRLDAALSAFLVVGRHLLARLTGRASLRRGTKLTLSRKIASTVGLTELVLIRRVDLSGAEPVGSKVFPMEALTRADGWAVVPADSEGYPPGSTIEMHALP
jgi:molybdopterin molybdotransferase